MTTQLFVVILLAVVVAVYLGVALSAWIKMRGKRVVICPETQQPAAVEVDAGHAAVSALWEGSDIRLSACSRWPERAGCDQSCATQIAIAPHDTLATSVLKRWYADKSCAICHKAIPPIHKMEPKPGLYNAVTHQTLAWEEIPAEHLPLALESHLPVCASCQVAETFRRQFPELVVDRDNRPTPPVA